MRPGHDFSKLTLEFIFKLPEETEIKSQYEEIVDLDFTCYSSFHVRVNNLISWYGESLSWIFDCGEILMTPYEFDSNLKDHMNVFALWSITVFGRDGYKEYSAEEYKTQLPLMKEFILVDISVNYQNRSFVIPTYKKWVQLRAS